MEEDKKELHTRQVTVRVTDDLYRILDSYAKSMTVSISTVIKLAVSEWRAKREKEGSLEDK